MDIDGLRNMMFVFKTKSKRNIIQLFNFRSSKANNIDETQIKEVNDYFYIPIDLKNWLDIDTNKCLERVLTTLLHLTDPKSGRRYGKGREADRGCYKVGGDLSGKSSNRVQRDLSEWIDPCWRCVLFQWAG